MSAQNGSGTMGKANVKVRTENVSPAMAKRLLAANQRNRNLRPTRVAQLAGAMTRGEWELNGETVKKFPVIDGLAFDAPPVVPLTKTEIKKALAA